MCTNAQICLCALAHICLNFNYPHMPNNQLHGSYNQLPATTKRECVSGLSGCVSGHIRVKLPNINLSKQSHQANQLCVQHKIKIIAFTSISSMFLPNQLLATTSYPLYVYGSQCSQLQLYKISCSYSSQCISIHQSVMHLQYSLGYDAFMF